MKNWRLKLRRPLAALWAVLFALSTTAPPVCASSGSNVITYDLANISATYALEPSPVNANYFGWWRYAHIYNDNNQVVFTSPLGISLATYTGTSASNSRMFERYHGDFSNTTNYYVGRVQFLGGNNNLTMSQESCLSLTIPITPGRYMWKVIDASQSKFYYFLEWNGGASRIGLQSSNAISFHSGDTSGVVRIGGTANSTEYCEFSDKVTFRYYLPKGQEYQGSFVGKLYSYFTLLNSLVFVLIPEPEPEPPTQEEIFYAYFDSHFTEINTNLTEINTSIQNGTISINNTITNSTNQILAQITPTPEAIRLSKEFQEAMSASTTQIQNNVQQIEDKTNRPDPDKTAQDIDPLKNLDPSDPARVSMYDGLGAILKTDFFLTILLMVFGMAFCAYVLFGKRG